MDLHKWETLSSDGRAMALTYSFGFGRANTLAAKLDDGTWMVVSPGAGLPDSALDEIAAKGDVSALIAPNAFHHLGQKAWRARFPNAKGYAHAGALERLAKQSGLGYNPIEELLPRLGNTVHVHSLPGMKAPDLLVDVATADGPVWFGGDLISNTSAEDTAWFPRMVFSLLGGGSGYRFNPVPSMVYLKDKVAWKAAAKAAFAGATPAVVLPAHGAPVRGAEAAGTAAMLA